MAELVPEASLLGKIAGYTEILSKDPRSTVFVPLSEAYRKMKMLDDAIEVASRGVAALPNYAPGFIALARAQAEHGMVSQAADAFGNVLKLEEDNIQGLKGLARVRMMQGRIKDARELLARAKNLSPDDPQIDGMLASLHHEASGPTVDSSDMGIAAPIATATLAEIYVKQGLLSKAFDIYSELHQIDPNNTVMQARLNELRALIKPDAGSIEQAQNNFLIEMTSSTAVSVVTTETPSGAEIEVNVATEDVHAKLNQWLELIRRRRKNV